MTIHKEDTLVFVAQKAFIKRGDKVLVMRDPRYVTDTDVGLDFPGGKYRFPNDITDELTREVTEETGLTMRIGRPFYVWTAEYKEKKKAHKKAYLVGFLCEYVSGEVKLSDEHDKFEWVDEKNYKRWYEPTGYFKALEEYFIAVRTRSSAG